MEDQIHKGMVLKNVQLCIILIIWTREYLVYIQDQAKVTEGRSQGQIKLKKRTRRPEGKVCWMGSPKYGRSLERLMEK